MPSGKERVFATNAGPATLFSQLSFIWCCKIATSDLAKNEILVIIYAYVKKLTQFFKNLTWRKPYKNTFLWVSDLANADIDRPFVVCFYMVCNGKTNELITHFSSDLEASGQT